MTRHKFLSFVRSNLLPGYSNNQYSKRSARIAVRGKWKSEPLSPRSPGARKWRVIYLSGRRRFAFADSECRVQHLDANATT
ncbi:hypothetical protein AB1N83_012689 [Pleurotus pulmonarius]